MKRNFMASRDTSNIEQKLLDSQRAFISSTLETATQHHNSGNFAAAEAHYRQVLQLDPAQPVALHLLGLISHQQGQHDVAATLMAKAVANEPSYTLAHFNLGNTLQELGRFDEAVACYGKAIALQTDFAEAYSNQGNAQQVLGQFDGAETSYKNAIRHRSDFADPHCNLSVMLQKQGRLEEAIRHGYSAIEIEPTFAEAHNNLGVALLEVGRLDEAADRFRSAIEAGPNYAEARSNLGKVLTDLGRSEEAVKLCHEALAIKPDFVEAHRNLGAAYQEMGALENAFSHRRQATILDPKNDAVWTELAATLRTISFAAIDQELCQILMDLLDRPMGRPVQIVRPILSALQHHPVLEEAFERVNSENEDASYDDVAIKLSSVPLLLKLMATSVINDPGIERLLTLLRRSLVLGGRTELEPSLPFLIALAHHCFTNEYVFMERADETAAVEQLEMQLASAAKDGRDMPSALFMLLAAYRPLYQYPWAPDRGRRLPAQDLRPLIDEQITDPLEELSLSAELLRLTPIRNAVSQSVRSQYEENPYPRWREIELTKSSKTIRVALQAAPLRLDLEDYVSPDNPQILIAGCGTGQHALSAASRYSNASVLAIDLSLNSLAYALRKSRQYQFSNIEFAQADIMELGTLGREFDLIECSGVLHHLEDPISGWQVLLDCLRPKGLMKIALYSEAARRTVVKARASIAQFGYSNTPEDIRRCRQEIIDAAQEDFDDLSQLTHFNDFYSLSECRDLLFHVQEHRFTLPQIKAALRKLDLNFLGFAFGEQSVLHRFRTAHPEKAAHLSLDAWHEFETENPDTFQGMYQFWCQKIRKIS